MLRPILALSVLLLAAPAVAQPLPAPAPPPLPTATAAPSAVPSEPPTAAATPSAAPASPTPLPSPTVNPFAYVIEPSPGPSGAPQVTEIAVTDRVLHSGGAFQVRITTTADVAACNLEAYGQSLPLQRAGIGLFTLAGTIPQVPFFYLNRNYTLTVVVASQDGRSNRVPFGMRLER